MAAALKLRMSVWAERHAAAAEDFCALVLRIRAEGAQKFQEGMWGLWQAAEALHPVAETEKQDIDPTTSALFSCYHIYAGLPILKARRETLDNKADPYGAVSQRWLLSFEAMGRQLRDEHAGIWQENGCQAAALKTLFEVLSPCFHKGGARGLCRLSGDLANTYACRWRPAPLGLANDTLEPPRQVENLQGSDFLLPLVWLPLAMYVRSTSHLYEMLRRLKYSAQTKYEIVGVERLRAVLDKDQRQYSFLAFAITAALQSLILAKMELGKRFPWRLLASSPPDPARTISNGYPMTAASDWATVSPIFRGIWVNAELDEERIIYQYSFQSWSREVAGVVRVLDFYASVRDTPTALLARECGHVLFLVSRVKWNARNSFAVPVQLFDGPRESGSEAEVLFPPYVTYELEDLAISSEDFANGKPSEEGKAKLKDLSHRWCGFKMPDLLLEMLARNPVPSEYPDVREIRPFVSVRFVRSIDLVEPLYSLFTDPALRLYDFEAVGEPTQSFGDRAPGCKSATNSKNRGASGVAPRRSPTPVLGPEAPRGQRRPSCVADPHDGLVADTKLETA